jgi:hypothetical protein
LTLAGAIQLGLAILSNYKLEYLTVGEFRIPLYDIRGMDYISQVRIIQTGTT